MSCCRARWSFVRQSSHSEEPAVPPPARRRHSVKGDPAGPFKRWLARVGKERIDEIENPELAMGRMQELYEKKGYPNGRFVCVASSCENPMVFACKTNEVQNHDAPTHLIVMRSTAEYRVVSVRPREHLRLAVRITDGLTGEVVMKKSHLSGVFQALNDPGFSLRCRVRKASRVAR
jgi:hypothetical protein